MASRARTPERSSFIPIPQIPRRTVAHSASLAAIEVAPTAEAGHALQVCASLVSRGDAVPVSGAGWELTNAIPQADAAMLQESIAALCAEALWLRSWWASYQRVISADAPQAASSGHDHIVMAAASARAVLRRLGMDVDESAIVSHQWPDSRGMRRAPAREMVGGAA